MNIKFKNVLITGAAHRVGAAMAHYFHQRGWRVAIHYHQSEAAARSQQRLPEIARATLIQFKT